MPQYIMNPSMQGLQMGSDLGRANLQLYGSAISSFLNNTAQALRDNEQRLYEAEVAQNYMNAGLLPSGTGELPKNIQLPMAFMPQFRNRDTMLRQALIGHDASGNRARRSQLPSFALPSGIPHNPAAFKLGGNTAKNVEQILDFLRRENIENR